MTKKQNIERKKYWLKLDKDFLKSPQMKIIKSMQNGKDYIIFYLSLMLESVETVGHLRFTSLIPYNDEMLSAITETNIDVVRSAIKIFCELGLMQIFDDGTIFIPEVPKITGKECESAERVRHFREKQKQQLLQCNSDVTKCNTYIDKEEDKNKYKEEDKDIDKQQDKDDETIVEFFSNNIHSMTPIEYDKITSWEDIFSDDVIKKAIEIAVTNNVRTYSYIEAILRNWQKKGYKTVIDIEQENKEGQIEKEFLN